MFYSFFFKILCFQKKKLTFFSLPLPFSSHFLFNWFFSHFFLSSSFEQENCDTLSRCFESLGLFVCS
ncbi:hypothetical protein V6Z11_A05G317300 [Gossypium hirsutum]